MKIPAPVKWLFIGVTIISVPILIFIFAIVQATSGLTETADSFFHALKQGDTEEALESLSKNAQHNTTKAKLEQFTSQNSLQRLKDISWTSRSISTNEGGKLEGSINLEGGEKIPITMTFQKAGSTWKIYSIKQNRAGIINNLSAEVPSEEDLINLSSSTTRLFVSSIKNKSFQNFYQGISYAWKQETSSKELDKIFKSFLKFGDNANSMAYFSQLTTKAPAFSKEPTILDNGQLEITGTYPVQPIFNFTYKYVYEGLSWKLSGLKVNL
tara:strand:+ start:877 stop:1683 length:807 start_codon:yes stop_codon:yes gene_type:complete